MTKDLQNNTVVNDALPFNLPITLTPKRVCCVEPCDTVQSYTWKVYRVWYPVGVSYLVGAGQNSPVSFTPDFEDGF